MKRLLLTLIQTAITVLLLWWIFGNPAKRAQMAGALREADYLWLIPGILSIGCCCILQTQRWRVLLAAQQIDLGWWRTLRVYLIGAFFNLFLLGATGGDIVKIYYAMRETASKSAAFLSVLVDRMMGLLGLVAVAAVLCSLRFDLLVSKPLTQTLTASLFLIIGVSLALIIAGFLVDHFHLAHKLPSWLPLRARVIELSTAFSTYARNPRSLLLAFCFSVPSHLFIFLAFYFAARAFGVFEGFSGLVDMFATLPAIMTVASLPISLSGMGVREQLFQNTFSELFAIPDSIAVMISISGFLMMVFWGLVGGAVYLAYRPGGGIHLREINQDVAHVEETIEENAESCERRDPA